MKNINKFWILTFISLAFLGCEKDGVPEITKPYDGALFKTYNFVVVKSNPASGASTVTFNSYANNVKFAATVSTNGTEAAAGLVVGGVSPARGYALVPAGDNVKFSALSSSTAVVNATYGFGPNLEIASVVASVQNKKNYSFYVCGLFDKTTQKADAFIIEDKLPAPDTGAAYIRLVNPAPGTSTLSLETTRTYKVDGVDVVDVATPINGVAYKTASEFVKVPSGSYTFRCIDQATNKIVTRTATNLLRNRIYTFTMRGDMVGAGVSYPTVFLDFTENR